MASAPVLVCPDYTKEFIMYNYANDHTYSAILMHNNNEGVKSPIAFMSYPLKAHELKYSEMEKHAFAMVKSVKHFIFYILNSHVIALVPNAVVKSILTQQEFGTKRGNWVAKIQEYDMEIKPTKLVHGKGYCWLTLFKDACSWVRKCKQCQQFVGKPKLVTLPLKPMVIEEPFQQWGLDFVGPVYPTSSVGNGQDESRNKNLVTIIRKLVDERQWTWHKALYDALWADCIAPKRAIDMSFFQLLYGLNVELPITLELPALKLAKAGEDETYQGSLDKWIMFLSQLEETRAEVVDRIFAHQSQVKALFDKKATSREFTDGDQILLWDKRREPKGMHEKFDSLWRGPFTIHEVCGEHSFLLAYVDGTSFSLPQKELSSLPPWKRFL
ncbi:uncharacterized protein LOC131876648 [Cryptomeria japonica]|uniref:uncharacterized protein LOC131876648 n=1 Tax=Cryptomeria japonica TaxID=3369 RepID=UPI0027DA3308|nr:uncharacterized protein LOC131876648 [Cryptomeria japonica]